jgi:2'-5' RNA ligase
VDDSIRAFASVEPPVEVKRAVLACMPSIDGVRVLHENLMHITLAFFGYVDKGRLDALLKGLREINFPSFEVSMHGLGLLASGNRAVLFADVKEGSRELASLHSAVARVGADAGMPDTRKFKAHMTAARIRDVAPLRKQLGKYIKDNAENDFGGFTCTSFGLFSSLLTPEGPVYSALASVNLG